MVLINDNYLRLPESYLFSDIKKKVTAFKASHPEAKIISLGIGDVTRPLPPTVIAALHKAVDEMAHVETFRGYGPEQGYRFLIDAIIKNDYESRGVRLSPSEVFISDGAKSDTGNIGDILSKDNRVAITDPVYPVYVDTNLMDGRRIVYMNGTAENDFLPMPDPSVKADLIYLCSPNNPTGACYSKEQLEKWVAYAKEMQAAILFDAAYEAYIYQEDIPHSIYE